MTVAVRVEVEVVVVVANTVLVDVVLEARMQLHAPDTSEGAALLARPQEGGPAARPAKSLRRLLSGHESWVVLNRRSTTIRP